MSNSPVSPWVIDELAAFMAAEGLTQTDVSMRTDISQSTVSGWFKGATPHRRARKAIARMIAGASAEVDPVLPTSLSTNSAFTVIVPAHVTHVIIRASHEITLEVRSGLTNDANQPREGSERPSSDSGLRPGRKRPLSITSASRRLGVNKSHLNKVLKGERESSSLTERYNALVEEMKGGQPE